MPDANLPCPCGKSAGRKPLIYSHCCGRYVDDFSHSPAPDAESLMRSRYCAFVLQRADYLLATWDPATRPATLTFDTGTRWLGLSIRRHETLAPDQAQVEFVARSRINGQGMRLHERSSFTRRDGRWFYVDGDMLD